MSTSASTLATTLPIENPLHPSLLGGGDSVTGSDVESGESSWRSELNAKLAAHRMRRSGESHASPRRAQSADGGGSSSAARAMAASVAARVAERYANAPSYSQILAAQAAAAAEAAETAVFAAQQAHDAAQVLLSSLDRQAQEDFAAQALAETALHVDASPLPSEWNAPSIVEIEMERGAHGDAVAASSADSYVDSFPEPVRSLYVADATVEHHEPLPVRMEPPPRAYMHRATGIVDAFAEAIVTPAMSLPAKLIEFPRELIAPRKSRPRIAEGPLVEDSLYGAQGPSLRIFEVNDGAAAPEYREGATGSYGGSMAYRADDSQRHGQSQDSSPLQPQASLFGSRSKAQPSDWQSIRLGEHPASRPPQGDDLLLRHRRHEELPATAPLEIASIGDRCMAALVDVVIVGCAFLLFVLVFAACTTHPPAGKAAIVSAAGLLGGLFLLYEWIFMSYGGGTPGMRYAHIALCTFDDENPTRRMMRSRVGAMVFSALALGLGFVWALFDEEKLGWHDRMTRTYQRSYR